MNKPSTYLYGTSLKPYMSKPYFEVLLAKITLAKKLLLVLVRDDNMEDPKRINDVSNAIRHNRELLMELGLSSTEVTSLLDETTIN